MARARAGGLFPEAAPQALLQARQQPRIGPRAAGPAVTPEDRQRLLVLLAIRDTILILLIAVSLAGLRGGTPRNPQYARPAAIAWRMRRMTIRYGGRWKKSRAFPGTQPRAATDEPRATSHEPRAASDEPRATSHEPFAGHSALPHSRRCFFATSYPQRRMRIRACKKRSKTIKFVSKSIKKATFSVKKGSKKRAFRHAHLNILWGHPLWR